jgi:hypothetical protein
MTVARLFAVAVIYAGTTLAWLLLGGSVVTRSGDTDERLAREVARLWGGRHEQTPPEVAVERPDRSVETVREKDESGATRTRKVVRETTRRDPLPLESSRVRTAFHLDPRRKGLLWYDTWSEDFEGRYRVRNPDRVPRTVALHVPFPSSEALYDDFALRLDGREIPFTGDLAKGASAEVPLPPETTAELQVSYRTRGFGPWIYAPGAGGAGQVRDFELDMALDFDRVDFPPGTISPTTRTPDGRHLTWRFERLVSGQKIGMDPPDRLNPGPFAARVTFFAPVGLLFFMSVLVILGLVRGPALHPMHWFFLAAAFFSFHLLLAYLVDHVSVHAAFALSAATSLFLVTSYLRLVTGTRFALLRAGVAQLVFLVLFSYSFFLEGYTGLTITVGAIATLFVLMQSTARVDWTAVFAAAESGRAPFPGARAGGLPPPGQS